MMKRRIFNLPSSILELAFIIMLVFILCQAVLLNNVNQEYKTRVDLLKKRNRIENQGFKPDMLSLAIKKEESGIYDFVLESKKMGVHEYKQLSNVIKELDRICPLQLILRVDKAAEFHFPQEIMIWAHENKADLGFAYKQER